MPRYALPVDPCRLHGHAALGLPQIERLMVPCPWCCRANYYAQAGHAETWARSEFHVLGVDGQHAIDLVWKCRDDAPLVGGGSPGQG